MLWTGNRFKYCSKSKFLLGGGGGGGRGYNVNYVLLKAKIMIM